MADGPGHRPWRKSLGRWAGLVVLAACLIYLGRALAALDLGRLLLTLTWQDWLLTAALSLGYAASLGLLAKGWAAMAAPGRRFSLRRLQAIYGPGVIAKYLPGSIFQYVSRQVIGRRHGFEHAPMAKASVIEAGLHVAIALGFASCLLAGAGWWAVVGAAALGLALAIRPSRPIIAALACQLLFFSVYAASMIVLARFGALAVEPGRLAGYFFLAWTVGLLVPVAPGGIGVREAVLFAIAVPAENANAVALLALLARVVGIVGDAAFGVIGHVLAGRVTRENRQAF